VGRARAAALGALAVAAVAVAVWPTAPAAWAESATEVRSLAEQAKHDPAALDRLKRVEVVDGRPVDLHQALSGASGADLDRRLDELASSVGAGPGEGPSTPGQAPSEQARRILAARRFQPSQPPRPFAGLIHRLGEILQPVVRPLGRWLAPVGRLLLRIYHNAVLMGLACALVIGLAALFTLRLVRRRARTGVGRDGELLGVAVLDPRELDRQADAAEAAGDLEHAFRLRFVAGVLRLDRAGALRYRPSLTTGELVRSVKSATFPGLAAAFDEIAYGGRRPEPEDLARAKADWPRVL